MARSPTGPSRNVNVPSRRRRARPRPVSGSAARRTFDTAPEAISIVALTSVPRTSSVPVCPLSWSSRKTCSTLNSPSSPFRAIRSLRAAIIRARSTAATVGRACRLAETASCQSSWSRYPSPRRVTSRWGRAGSSSSLCRRRDMSCSMLSSLAMPLFSGQTAFARSSFRTSAPVLDAMYSSARSSLAVSLTLVPRTKSSPRVRSRRTGRLGCESVAVRVASTISKRRMVLSRTSSSPSFRIRRPVSRSPLSSVPFLLPRSSTA